MHRISLFLKFYISIFVWIRDNMIIIFLHCSHFLFYRFWEKRNKNFCFLTIFWRINSYLLIAKNRMNDYSFVNDRKIGEYNTSEYIFIYQYKEFYIILDILISWDKKEEIIRYWYNFQNDNFIKYYRKICTKSEKN